jgi:glutathione S-transferase
MPPHPQRDERVNGVLGVDARGWDTPRRTRHDGARHAGEQMAKLTLIIGNKNYSSWSLRPWFLLAALDIPFTEQRIALYGPGSRERILAVSPSGKVPALQDGALTVWDSLAICEYVAELFPDRQAWPRDAALRAAARSVAAEMHSGFAALREALPMNCRARGRRAVLSEAVTQDIDRVTSIWRDCRARCGGTDGWLFGTFSIADAMFAPIAFRFATYGVACDAPSQAYADTLLAHPAMQRWAADAAAETEVIEHNEVGRVSS